MREIKPTSYGCVFYCTFYNLYGHVFYAKGAGTQLKFQRRLEVGLMSLGSSGEIINMCAVQGTSLKASRPSTHLILTTPVSWILLVF